MKLGAKNSKHSVTKFKEFVHFTQSSNSIGMTTQHMEYLISYFKFTFNNMLRLGIEFYSNNLDIN